MSARRLRAVVTFQAEVQMPDGGGGFSSEWQDVATVAGAFTPERGRERVQAGRLEASLAGTLRVRASSTTRAITEQHRAVIAGEPYQIRSIADPDQRNRWLEMTVERGVAQ